MKFSYLGSTLELISIAPVKNIPLQGVMQIAEAQYDPENQELQVVFRDGRLR